MGYSLLDNHWIQCDTVSYAWNSLLGKATVQSRHIKFCYFFSFWWWWELNWILAFHFYATYSCDSGYSTFLLCFLLGMADNLASKVLRELCWHFFGLNLCFVSLCFLRGDLQGNSSVRCAVHSWSLWNKWVSCGNSMIIKHLCGKVFIIKDARQKDPIRNLFEALYPHSSFY